MDSGYIYCPYVPLLNTPVVLDPETFLPKKGVFVKYSKKLLEEGGHYYAKMSLSEFAGNEESQAILAAYTDLREALLLNDQTAPEYRKYLEIHTPDSVASETAKFEKVAKFQLDIIVIMANLTLIKIPK